jgi:hypothetical protein
MPPPPDASGGGVYLAAGTVHIDAIAPATRTIASSIENI